MEIPIVQTIIPILLEIVLIKIAIPPNNKDINNEPIKNPPSVLTRSLKTRPLGFILLYCPQHKVNKKIIIVMQIVIIIVIKKIINFEIIIFHRLMGFERIMISVPSSRLSLKITTVIIEQIIAIIITIKAGISINVLFQSVNGDSFKINGTIKTIAAINNHKTPDDIQTDFFFKVNFNRYLK
jgi:hypothetical protein